MKDKEMSGAPKHEPLSPEAVAFRDSLLKHGARESAEVDGLLMSDFLDFAARLFDAHRVNTHASLVAQIQRKDEALKAAQHCIDQNLPHAEDVEAQIAEALKGESRG